MPFGISCSLLLMISFGMRASLRGYRHRRRYGLRRLRIDALLHDMAEMADQALNRPGRCIAERADGVALDLIADIKQHIDLADLCFPARHALQHAPHPAGALTYARSLAAALARASERL